MQFEIPAKSNVSQANKIIFENLEQSIGRVPNLYAIMAYSPFGLMRFLAFQNSASLLSKKEKVIVNLVASHTNNCSYCLREHSYIARLNGFSEKEILNILNVNVRIPKLNALSAFTKVITGNRGLIADEQLEKLFESGYGPGHLIDIVLQVSENIATNYLYNLTHIPIDFPESRILK